MVAAIDVQMVSLHELAIFLGRPFQRHRLVVLEAEHPPPRDTALGKILDCLIAAKCLLNRSDAEFLDRTDRPDMRRESGDVIGYLCPLVAGESYTLPFEREINRRPGVGWIRLPAPRQTVQPQFKIRR